MTYDELLPPGRLTEILGLYLEGRINATMAKDLAILTIRYAKLKEGVRD